VEPAEVAESASSDPISISSSATESTADAATSSRETPTILSATPF